MARHTGAVCKLCRRESMKLFLKGARCNTGSCSFTKRSYAPGDQGKRRKKLSDYALHLREKQKVRRIYGVLERQFKNYYRNAAKKKESTGLTLLQTLERRLDNVLFRMCVSPSRSSSRQLIAHGFAFVNGRKVDIPSYQVREGDSVVLKGSEEAVKNIRERSESTKDRPKPEWLSVDAKSLSAKVVRLPRKEDIQLPVNEQLIVEYYSR